MFAAKYANIIDAKVLQLYIFYYYIEVILYRFCFLVAVILITILGIPHI